MDTGSVVMARGKWGGRGWEEECKGGGRENGDTCNSVNSKNKEKKKKNSDRLTHLSAR